MVDNVVSNRPDREYELSMRGTPRARARARENPLSSFSADSPWEIRVHRDRKSTNSRRSVHPRINVNLLFIFISKKGDRRTDATDDQNFTKNAILKLN